MINEITELMGFSRNTYFNWKKENRKIILLLEKYFDEQMLKEYISTNKINKFENKSNDILQINEILIDHIRYQLRDKLKNYTDGSFFDWANKLVPKKYLQKILKDIFIDKTELNISNSKDELISRIKGLEVTLINKKNQQQLSDYIQNHLSKIECFVLIQEHEEIMNYKGFWK